MTENKNADVAEQFLTMLPHVVDALVRNGQAAKIGDAINEAVMKVGRLVKARLDTDANYAAGVGELARTAAHRMEQLEKLDKDILRLEDDLDDASYRINEAIAKVETLLRVAEDLGDGPIKDSAKAALRSILATLGKPVDEHVDPQESEEPKQGTASCDKGHTWPCAWSIATSARPDGGFEHRRIVFPEACPTCGGKWQEVETDDENEEKGPDA